MLVEDVSAVMFGRLVMLVSSTAAEAVSVAIRNGFEVVRVKTGTVGRRILGSGIAPEATRDIKHSPTPTMWPTCRSHTLPSSSRT